MRIADCGMESSGESGVGFGAHPPDDGVVARQRNRNRFAGDRLGRRFRLGNGQTRTSAADAARGARRVHDRIAGEGGRADVIGGDIGRLFRVFQRFPVGWPTAFRHHTPHGGESLFE